MSPPLLLGSALLNTERFTTYISKAEVAEPLDFFFLETFDLSIGELHTSWVVPALAFT
jgi:hypothetical protein